MATMLCLHLGQPWSWEGSCVPQCCDNPPATSSWVLGCITTPGLSLSFCLLTFSMWGPWASCVINLISSAAHYRYCDMLHRVVEESMTKDPWVNKIHQAITYRGNCVCLNKKLWYRFQHQIWAFGVWFYGSFRYFQKAGTILCVETQ